MLKEKTVQTVCDVKLINKQLIDSKSSKIDIHSVNCLPALLWIELKYNKKLKNDYVTQFSGICRVEFVHNVGEIDNAIQKCKPSILCFDYDLPNPHDFDVLRKTKFNHPSLPLVVIIVDKSVEWAILALRIGVTDYFVRPLPTAEFERMIKSLVNIPVNQKIPRNNFIPHSELFHDEVQSGVKHNRLASRMATATSYVRQQLHRKLTLENVAKNSGMSKSHFSRSFKSVLGVSFQEYLSQQRIERALGMLKNTDLPITEVALSVGFQELSNFSTTFQKHIGMRPSCFRKALMFQGTTDSGTETLSTQFPSVNPSPVLSYEFDGRPKFVNPATLQLLRELNLNEVENILPYNHDELLTSSIKSGNTSTEKRQFCGRTFVWSYHPIQFADIIFVYGYDVSDFVSSKADFKKFPVVNPNPVLTSDPTGNFRFINPATMQMLKDIHAQDVKELLPVAHKKLVKACIKTNTPLTEKHIVSDKTIVWSYQPINDRDLIYIYGRVVVS